MLSTLKDVRISGFSAKLQSVELYLQERDKNSFTKRKTGECFEWKANGSCSRRESRSFLHSPDSGNREITREEVENARGSGLNPAVGSRELRRKGKEPASSSVPKVKAQTDVKSSTSLEANPGCNFETKKSKFVYLEIQIQKSLFYGKLGK